MMSTTENVYVPLNLPDEIIYEIVLLTRNPYSDERKQLMLAIRTKGGRNKGWAHISTTQSSPFVDCDDGDHDALSDEELYTSAACAFARGQAAVKQFMAVCPY